MGSIEEVAETLGDHQTASCHKSVSLAHLVARKCLSLIGGEVIYYQSLLIVSHWALIPH